MKRSKASGEENTVASLQKNRLTPTQEATTGKIGLKTSPKTTEEPQPSWLSAPVINSYTAILVFVSILMLQGTYAIWQDVSVLALELLGLILSSSLSTKWRVLETRFLEGVLRALEDGSKLLSLTQQALKHRPNPNNLNNH